MGRRFVFIMFLTVLGMTAFAQVDGQKQAGDEERKKSYLYQWTDDSGGVHITDGLGKVPKQYRGTSVKIEQLKTEAPEQGQQQVQPGPVAAPGRKKTDELAKTEWQRRLRAVKERLENAEQRYGKLDAERTELLGARGPTGMAPAANRVRAEEIAEEMKDVRREIDDARYQIEVGLPDEARKAGVPPGWLRE